MLTGEKQSQMKVSEKDIVYAIAENPRASFEAISQHLKISDRALRHRIWRLRRKDEKYADLRRMVLLYFFEWTTIADLVKQSADGKTPASITLLQMMGSLPKEQATGGNGWNVNITMRQTGDGGKEMVISGSPKPTLSIPESVEGDMTK